MVLAVFADADSYWVPLKTSRSEHWEMFWNVHLGSDAFDAVASPVCPCQCARPKSVSKIWPEVFRNIRQTDTYRQPESGCDPLHTPFRVLLSKKGTEFIEVHLFFNPKADNQLGKSIGNVIIAQFFKHVSGTLLYCSTQLFEYADQNSINRERDKPTKILLLKQTIVNVFQENRLS